jgi:hypothetical protein
MIGATHMQGQLDVSEALIVEAVPIISQVRLSEPNLAAAVFRPATLECSLSE